MLGTGIAAWLAFAPAGHADVTNGAPDFKEVYDLIRSNLAGITDADLDHAAVLGLLHEMRPKVSLVSNATAGSSTAAAPLLTQSSMFDGGIVYLRVGRVGEGLAEHLSSTCKKLAGTNLMKGVVLDLRFADGHDYAAAAAAAEIFIGHETPLLDWGTGPVSSKAKSDALTLPLAVLVNHETAAAAEALTAVLRESAHAMVLGGTTAGEATTGKEFPLKNGQSLRIATAAVKLGSGETLSASGLKPDIEVTVRPEDERAYLADPYKDPTAPVSLTANSGESGTNRPRPRTSEADLIRERKERPGMELEFGASPNQTTSGEGDKPVVHDPVLGRALDLIRGIAAMHPARTP
jgi:hypothetical protein